MLDYYTKKPITVYGEKPHGGYIIVRVQQLPEVKQLLENHGIPYSVDDWTLSRDGQPPVAFVNLKRHTDPATVQTLLDQVA